VADPTPLRPVSPLDAVREPGNHGTLGPDGPGVTLSEVRDVALVAVMAARRDRAALARAVDAGLGLALPEPNRSSGDAGLMLAFAGFNKWLAIGAKTDGPALMSRLGRALGDTATLADQSHGQTVLEIAGPAAREVLAKGAPVDLHPKVFAFGDVALTHMNHLHVLLWRQSLDSYRLVVMRSFARDLHTFLATQAAPVGYRVPAV
jgi:sarcosine oxidase subunit gamma